MTAGWLEAQKYQFPDHWNGERRTLTIRDNSIVCLLKISIIGERIRDAWMRRFIQPVIYSVVKSLQGARGIREFVSLFA